MTGADAIKIAQIVFNADLIYRLSPLNDQLNAYMMAPEYNCLVHIYFQNENHLPHHFNFRSCQQDELKKTILEELLLKFPDDFERESLSSLINKEVTFLSFG